MITVQIKDGRRQPYLSTDRNHIQADTTRSLGGQRGQVPKEIRPLVSEEMRYREKVYRRVDGRTDGRRTVPVWVKL